MRRGRQGGHGMARHPMGHGFTRKAGAVHCCQVLPASTAGPSASFTTPGMPKTDEGVDMSDTPEFMDHWVNIDPKRMELYETMYEWNPASEPLYAPAEIGEGQVVADFGCGPGHAAIEFAKRVGPSGHVHALDVNAGFVDRAREKAKQAGLFDRITVHLLQDSRIPLADNSLDRVVARNTIIYVEDPVFTYGEFRRTLRPGGIAHAIEGDWSLTAVVPVESADWRQIISAASWAWRRPEIGRQLYGFARRAGFENVSLEVVTIPDTEGRLNGMIKSVTDYARRSGELDDEKIDSVLETVNRGMDDGSYLAISPQFLVTAVARGTLPPKRRTTREPAA